MRKKILVFILVLAMLLPCVFMLSACNGAKRSSNLNLTGGSRPQYESLFSSDNQSLINAAMSENATEEQKNQAAMALFNTANYSRKNTPLSLMLQDSNAGIDAGDVVMHAFNLRSGDKWYYQLVAEATADSDFMTAMMSMIAGLVKIAYTNDDGTYSYTHLLGATSNCDCKVETFPYSKFDHTKDPTIYNAEEFKEIVHYIDSFHEVVNMEFCAEILKDVEITYNADEGYYHVNFAIDMDADPVLLAKWYAMVKKDVEVAGSFTKFERYNYYEAELEVWDNGYAKSFKSRSSRAANFASGNPTDAFTFLWVESEIMQLLHEDERLSLVNRPDTIEGYIDYYSNPEKVAVNLSQDVIGVIVTLVVVGVVIIGAIVAAITISVLLKKGKLPKLAAWRDARKQKRLDKKAAKRGEKNETPDDENENLKPDEEITVPEQDNE